MAEHLLCYFVVCDYLHYNTEAFFRCYEIVNDKAKKRRNPACQAAFFILGYVQLLLVYLDKYQRGGFSPFFCPYFVSSDSK